MKNLIQFLQSLSQCMDEINTGEEPEQRIEVPEFEDIKNELIYSFSIGSIAMFAISTLNSPQQVSFSSILSVISTSATVLRGNPGAMLNNLSYIATVKSALACGGYAHGFFSQVSNQIDEVDLPVNLIKNITKFI